MHWSFSLDEIETIAGELLQHLLQSKVRVVALHGEMGAGKTTLVSALLKAMGSSDHASSPTFSIINEYKDKESHPVYHMDWYRLRDEEEALNAGVEEPLYSGYWCLIEWPGRASGLLPEEAIHLYISANDRGERTVSL